MKTMKELKSYAPPAGRKVIVIGPNVYGIGKTGAEAYRLARNPKQWVAFDCHAKAYVSHMDGSIHVDGEDNTEELTSEQLIVEVGRKMPASK